MGGAFLYGFRHGRKHSPNLGNVKRLVIIDPDMGGNKKMGVTYKEFIFLYCKRSRGLRPETPDRLHIEDV